MIIKIAEFRIKDENETISPLWIECSEMIVLRIKVHGIVATKYGRSIEHLRILMLNRRIAIGR
jgi:hypothetical protein